jgi:hypothetical protein
VHSCTCLETPLLTTIPDHSCKALRKPLSIYGSFKAGKRATRGSGSIKASCMQTRGTISALWLKSNESHKPSADIIQPYRMSPHNRRMDVEQETLGQGYEPSIVLFAGVSSTIAWC